MPNSPPRFVPRKATLQSDGVQDAARPLADWRGVNAYVLLAEPGAGKTRAFETESEATGGEYVKARDFIALDTNRFKGCEPIHIDGLDEIRAGSASFSGALDAVRSRLDALGRPSFRLSCREADWRSAVDRDSLRTVATGGELSVLHLAELDDGEISAILRDRGVDDPAAFLAEAERQGIRALLGNPLLLQLMVDAAGADPRQWPDSRTALYRKACEQLAVEHNERHRAERRNTLPSVERLMNDAGLLSSLHLLAGIPGFTYEADASQEALLVDAVPKALGVEDVHSALSSKLFVADSVLRSPRHRTIAEFLAARVIASRIAGGLPIKRVLSLMSGADGGIVDPLRGLHAWLATQCKQERGLLIDLDPLSVVLYGDPGGFSIEDKERILLALHREAERFPWFRKGQWHEQPFGALGTPDMVERFRALLGSPDRSQAHQSLLGCVLEAIEYGKTLPGVSGELAAVVRDPSFFSGTRRAALDAWLRQSVGPRTAFRALLDEIERGEVSDPDDELAGRLLEALYPEIVIPAEVFGYFRSPKLESFVGSYRSFWRRRLVPATPDESLDVLMESWVSHHPAASVRHPDSLNDHLSAELLEKALAAHGDEVPVETLYRWTGVALDKYGAVHLSDRDLHEARRWLGARPELLKALVAHGWSQLQADGDSGRRHFWKAEAHTLGATRPSDWYAWLLEQAARTDDEALARYCFYDAAHIAINPRPGFMMSMELVEAWVEHNRRKWPEGAKWLEESWSRPLNHWEAEHSKTSKVRKDKRSIEREDRRKNVLPHLASLQSGSAPPGLMHQVALTYDERYANIEGETPVERVQDFLGSTIEEAKGAIAGMEAVLDRADLPGAEEILRSSFEGRFHYIRSACLLGASLAFQRNPAIAAGWSDELAGTLAAFWLTEGVGEMPEWFSTLAVQRPAVIAPVYERFAIQQIRKRGESSIPGLWELAREEKFVDLARMVVPALLRAFPVRTKENRLRLLNAELLVAARRHLSAESLAGLLAERLALKSLDAPQRIAYLAAGLPIDGEKYSRALLRLVGASESRAAHLGRAIEWQGSRREGMPPLPAATIAKLIELVAPHASPERPTGAHWVSDADRRRDWVYQFINQLAGTASDEAAAELQRLQREPRLARWKSALDGAAFDQVRTRREVSFRHASAQDVVNVLSNASPANAQDLAALVLDHLSAIEAQWHGDDSNTLRLFRRDDGDTPKTENACRDILVPLLRARLLALGVGLPKEGQAKQDTRVDLRAEFVRPGQRIAVPIEIKKEDHRALWSAWRTQLLPYMDDPDAGGVGVYLVLYFGKRVRTSPEGHKPSSAKALLDLLSASIPEDHRHRLHVYVLDLSVPARARKTQSGSKRTRPVRNPRAQSR